MDSEDVQIELVWEAIDKFKEAEILAKGEDVEVVCMALVEIGCVYYKLVAIILCY